jgi:2-polyprenyl-3-methyl-5-hydroxy-6-metoxy-1,4-benzoquinol methylase
MTTGSGGPRGFSSWEALYENEAVESLPWFHRGLDADFAKAIDERALPRGARVLDQGTGPGTQALALARRGFVVTASDVAPAALAYAERTAKEQGAAITFVRDDVLATKLEGPFDAIFDRGCFHVLPPEARDGYAASMQRLLAPGGYLFLKTFSHLQPGDQGPHRFRPEEIRAVFAERFEVLDIVDTEFEGQLDPHPKALFSTLRRR